MRKVLTFLGASLCLSLVVPVRAQTAPDMFNDVPEDHWAYTAVEALRSKGILIGYPDGYFRGKRTLTRYEFAVALQRALEQVQSMQGEAGPAGPAGAAGPAGPPGPQGPAGITPEDVDALKRLANEFRQELANLGTNLNAVNARLDRLAREVADLREELNKRPRISGGAFVGIRSDRGNGNYLDRDGRVLGGGGDLSLRNTAMVVHQLQLGVLAKVGGDATLNAHLMTGNYKDYLGNMLGAVPVGSSLNTNPSSDTYIDRLELNAPFSAVGREGSLSIGRIAFNISPLTLWKPDVDTYFDNPMVDDRMYRMDGFRASASFGSLGVTAFAGQTMRVQGTGGPYEYGYDSVRSREYPYSSFGGFNSPLAGATTPSVFNGNAKPSGQTAYSAMIVDQLGGLSLTLPLRLAQGGEVRVTALQSTGTGGSGFDNVTVLGAGVDSRLTDRVTLTGEWAKTMTGTGRDIANVTNGQNTAITGLVGYTSGGFNLSAGYKYIDPLYYAPGYWGRIGNWLNPTNIQGPVFRAGYDFSPSFGLNVGGDFYSGARNGRMNSLSMDDEVNRVLVGVRWDLSRNFRTTLDWEGVYWSLTGDVDGGSGGAAGRFHPTEHYITLGTGYNLNDTTLLKLGYQIGSFDGRGTLTGGGGTGSRYNFNVFTSQVAVKF